MKYRPEIDGMRAIAVLAVVLFHAGVGFMSGGFIGVDVFFVLSGFLITTIIVTELQAGTFKYRGFFERRVRRILPALIFVCLACVPFAYLWMLPDEFQNFGQSLFATGLSVNNVLLNATADYWALDSEFKPLLHTWSLGVEEQYYLVVPILFALVWRANRRALPYVVGLIGVASLVLAVISVDRAPNFAFYMLPTRAWEIAAGAVMALVLIRRPELREHRYGPGLAALGLAAILIPIFLFDESTKTPGLALLIPVIGTCLTIAFASQHKGVGRVLATRPLVTIGLISFSAYLWHQPLFAFARIYAEQTPPLWVFLILSVCSLALAWATWRWVETPFRSRRRTRTRTVYAAAGAGVLAMSVIGFGLHTTSGIPDRLPATANAANATIAYNEAVFDLKADTFTGSTDRRVLVLGNSFSRDFVNAVQETFPDQIDTVDLVYRDDFPDCVTDATGTLRELYDDASVIIYASGDIACSQKNIGVANADGKDFLVVGTKDFGANLNWLMRSDSWVDQTNKVPQHILDIEAELLNELPEQNYVSWLKPTMVDAVRIPITDETGRVLTTDRRHFSQAGAIYFGARVLPGSPVEQALFGQASQPSA